MAGPSNRTARFSLALSIVTVLGTMTPVTLAATQSASSTSAATVTHGKWKLVWADDFNGSAGSAPNPKKWTYDIGRGPNGDGWGNNELEYYTNSTRNAFLDGHGHLVIRALKQNKDGQPYTSARLLTQPSASWTYGKIVIRAKLPKGGQGIWPAVWMLPTQWKYGGWPNSGEIDIVEMNSDPLTDYGTIHFGDSSAPAQVGTSWSLSNTGFHTFTLIWAPKTIQWYMDGHLYETVDSSQWYTPNAKSPAPFNQRFRLIMNLAVGGNWPGYPDASVTFPQQLVVDYVHVFQQRTK